MALVLPETSDGRVLFLVPWQNHVVIGTTDTPYDGDPTNPTADPADIEYLCDEMSTYLDVADVEPISAWAGLRALVGKAGGSTAKASREHEVVDVAPGYVRVAGGKLTGYRAIGQSVVDRLYGRRTRSRHGTATVQIHGAGIPEDLIKRVSASLESLGAPESLTSDIVARYGTAVDEMLDLAHHDLALAAMIADHWLAAEVVYGVRHESVATISDFVQRRTRIAWFTEDHARGALPHVGRIMAAELGWDNDQLAIELEHAERDLLAEGL
jgi:glycerol-3-phosphate dehydrogenase